MVLKLVSCEVFFREASLCAALSPNTIDAEFTPKGAHEDGETLRRTVQAGIDGAEGSGRAYDAVILGFGLCGNALSGIRARSVPVILPRAHDCCTLFLGSRKAFEERFRDSPSLPFSSAGYMERGGMFLREAETEPVPGVSGRLEDLIAKYGEENGRYIHETLGAGGPRPGDALVYVEVPELAGLGFTERCRARARESGMTVEVVPGDLRLIRMLADGEWDPREFLTVPPGYAVRGVYDWEEIVRAEKAD